MWLALLCAGAAAAYLVRLGGVPLFDGDEPKYAAACREMLARGDWITPYFNGTPRFQKPILAYWLILVAYKVFGVSELGARFWSALATLGLAGGVGAFVSRRLGVSLGMAAAAAILFNPQACITGRAATPDAVFAALIGAAMLCFYSAYAGGPSRRGLYYLFWLFTGLAGLTKGLAGLGLPLLVVAVFALWERRAWATVREMRPLQGALLCAGVAVPWFAVMVARYGGEFTGFFFGREHLERFARPMEEHSGPIVYYLAVLPLMFFPWGGLVPAGAWLSLRRGLLEGEPARLGRFALAWAGVVIGVFSLAGTKLPHYVYPAYPALALLAALALHGLARGMLAGRRRWWLGLPLLAGVLALAVVVAVGWSLLPRLGYAGALTLPAAAALGGGLVVTLAGAVALARGAIRTGAPTLATGAAGLVLTGGLLVAPQAHARLYGAPTRLCRLAARAYPSAHLAVWRSEFSPAPFYFPHPRVGMRARGQDLDRWLADRRPMLVLAWGDRMGRLLDVGTIVARDGPAVLVQVPAVSPPLAHRPSR